jgi:CcmD family protein
MSNWGYVGLAYGITYFVLGAYTLYLMRRRARAESMRADTHRMEA